MKAVLITLSAVFLITLTSCASTGRGDVDTPASSTVH